MIHANSQNCKYPQHFTSINTAFRPTKKIIGLKDFPWLNYELPRNLPPNDELIASQNTPPCPPRPRSLIYPPPVVQDIQEGKLGSSDAIILGRQRASIKVQGRDDRAQRLYAWISKALDRPRWFLRIFFAKISLKRAAIGGAWEMFSWRGLWTRKLNVDVEVDTWRIGLRRIKTIFLNKTRPLEVWIKKK